ncbi:XK-related protein 8-like isoform X1 [Hippocampus comes]|uniref:XK-related protein 8-like isoform X1 n=1 Tax=Hippocampus comes TaxID=109280 RepID=UPI00094EBBE6|nr:PREDICTED: XK-related protein 8-like isoform X1 [Hippocampus comes]XP_019721602.1 PREDICTED: XK-related protein 8-like isoform X1 [Hippocampus comes]
MSAFKFSKLDCFLTYVGLAFLLLDIGLDIWTAVSLYQEEDYVYLGILIFVLLGSSMLAQAYSWLWYTYDDFVRLTKVERCLSPRQLKAVHFLQLGVYFRHAGVVEITSCGCITKTQDPVDAAVFLTHDLSMLRLFEAFSESAPQLVLMLTIMLQRGQLDPLTVLKALGSASAIAFSVTTYHRSLRSFLPDKEEQRIASSLIYFVWNLLLIFSRLAAVALFASILPCFVFTHFICSWMILFFCAWRCKTTFMDSPGGEWLYQATVAVIWYFDWFNVVEERTRYKTTLYHGFILLDISLICGLWCWRMHTQPPSFKIPLLYACIIAFSVVAFYIFGLILKIIYYKCFHPNLTKKELRGDSTSASEKAVMFSASSAVVEDRVHHISDRSYTIEDVVDGAVSQADTRVSNKRMRKLAENFYS